MTGISYEKDLVVLVPDKNTESAVKGILTRPQALGVREVSFDPELEAWVWSDSSQVVSCLGWRADLPDLRQWLAENGFWPSPFSKPPDPKSAVERVLRELRKPRSSAIYAQLARRVSLQRCTDPAFLKFRHIMREWFGR